MPFTTVATSRCWWQHAQAIFRLRFSVCSVQSSPAVILGSVTRCLSVRNVTSVTGVCLSVWLQVLSRDRGSGGHGIHRCVSRRRDLECRHGCGRFTMGGTITTDAARNSLLFLLLLLLFGMLIHATNMAAAAPTTSSPSPDVSICMREGCNCTNAAPHWLTVTCSFDSKQASVVMAAEMPFLLLYSASHYVDPGKCSLMNTLLTQI